MSAGEFADEVARCLELPRVALRDLLGARPLVHLFAARFLREAAVYPFEASSGASLAVADPCDEATIHAARLVLGPDMTVLVASFEDISIALEQRLNEEGRASPEPSEASPPRADDLDSLRDLASGAPVVRAVNGLLEKALENRATDIHIEPFRNDLVVRLRVDGLLRPVAPPLDAPPQALISRVKILAGLNIAERRLPQDGATRVQVGRSELDIRVATMPTQYGESAVIRLLPRDRGLLDLDRLGLSARDERALRRLLTLPHGMIIITGPTGSGKTTSLATMLTILNVPSRKILTIEDPVEYELHGVNQSQVKPAIGLTFATALRSFVRQDPDVIMVGEIRDPETAGVAVHAALTGHLVLTTLHTESAAAAVPRLLDLGVEAFLLQSTLRAVIAQRLVRLLCDHCKTERRLTANDLASDPRLALLDLDVGEVVWEPGGCERCGHTGYRGRAGVFEVMEIDGNVRQLIRPDADAVSLERAAVQDGMTTLIADAVAKCRAGLTSPAEVLRVTAVR